jgi:hypothetical protein
MWNPTRSFTESATTVPISATAAAVVAWAAVVAARVFIVVATSASCLAVAASRVETLSCVLPMSKTSKVRVEEVAVTVVWRSAHEALRLAHDSRRVLTGRTRTSSSR